MHHDVTPVAQVNLRGCNSKAEKAIESGFISYLLKTSYTQPNSYIPRGCSQSMDSPGHFYDKS